MAAGDNVAAVVPTALTAAVPVDEKDDENAPDSNTGGGNTIWQGEVPVNKRPCTQELVAVQEGGTPIATFSITDTNGNVLDFGSQSILNDESAHSIASNDASEVVEDFQASQSLLMSSQTLNADDDLFSDVL